VVWSTATAAIFFARAFLFSTWLSRGPEVQKLLNLSTSEMGVFTMLFAVGGLTGILFASRLVKRFGSKVVSILSYTLGFASLMGLGLSIEIGILVVAGILLILMGLPMALVDFVGNVEGNAADRASKHSIFPAIHGAYGVGMLGGAAFSSWAISQGVSLTIHYFISGIVVAVVSITAGLLLPKHKVEAQSKKVAPAKNNRSRKVWTEKRSILIAIIGFSFIMAEMSAGTWVPIALTESGYSGSDAALMFGFLWIVITFGRLIGGAVVDRIGRHNTVLISALISALGILIFIAQDLIDLPILGLLLWGLGLAVGFPLSVAAMGDQEDMAPERINMIITVVYISSITVGPALGFIGQLVGVYLAFGIPLAFLVLSAILSPILKPIPNEPSSKPVAVG
jgi:fucose permease